MSEYGEPVISTPDFVSVGHGVYRETGHHKLCHVFTGKGADADTEWTARIVAVLNACAGIPTENLVSGKWKEDIKEAAIDEWNSQQDMHGEDA